MAWESQGMSVEAHAEVPAASSAAPDDRQLDLFARKPKPPRRGQLSLFGEPEEGNPIQVVAGVAISYLRRR
jgi:hypothetical protein